MNLPFNLFDILFAVVLAGGLLHGRKRGLTVEFPCLVKWLILLGVCTVFYGPLGSLIAKAGVFDLLTSYLVSYLGLGLAMLLLFSIVQRQMAPKLEGSDVFGRAEYYLGMGSGMLRYTCIMFCGLAVLNARAFSPAEVRAMERFQEDVYGSNLFPTLHSLQVAVFDRSLLGPWIKDGLGFMLITPTEPNQTEPAPAPDRSPKLQSAARH
jgi:hypothetical protein